MSEIVYRDESHAIQGAIFEVYHEMGSGFLESVYQECLELELRERAIPFETRVPLRLRYKGRLLERRYRADIICYNRIIVELKVAKTIVHEHRAQLINYLKSTGMRLGILVNFGGHPKADVERFVL